MSGQVYRLKKFGEKFSRGTHEGMTLNVLLFPRALSDEHHLRRGCSFSWHCVLSGFAKPTFRADENFTCDLFK